MIDDKMPIAQRIIIISWSVLYFAPGTQLHVVYVRVSYLARAGETAKRKTEAANVAAYS